MRRARESAARPYARGCPTAASTVATTTNPSADTADLYRYFDCTEAAEFLYSCVARTVEQDLPREIDYLRRHDEALRRIVDTVEMPDHVAENLIMFIRQQRGILPRRRREKEFKALTDAEVDAPEQIVNEAFEGFEGEKGEEA